MEKRLLGMLLPSINSLREILQAVRKKYNIPEVLPENVQLAKTLFQERTLEEWQAIGDEIEAKLRDPDSFISIAAMCGLILYQCSPHGYYPSAALSGNNFADITPKSYIQWLLQ